MSKTLTETYREPLRDLLPAAFALRRALFPDVLHLATPGFKHYQLPDHQNDRIRFAALSVTGQDCSLNCEHCRGELLHSMYSARSSDDLLQLGRKLQSLGCQGVLVSGGCDTRGRVPMQAHIQALAGLKELGLKVIVHTGLVDQDTAQALKAANVDQVLFDMVGDETTARRVFHLDAGPSAYVQALDHLLEAGLTVVPHIVIGLNFGEAAGELTALGQVLERGVGDLVMVVLTPLPNTPMEGVRPPSPTMAARLLACARLCGGRLNLRFGCARPSGEYQVRTEQYALKAGVNAIAYPAETTAERARAMGLETRYHDLCCSLTP
jgi:lipoyl synthase